MGGGLRRDLDGERDDLRPYGEAVAGERGAVVATPRAVAVPQAESGDRAAMGAAARRWALAQPAGAGYARRYEQVWDAAIARRGAAGA